MPTRNFAIKCRMYPDEAQQNLFNRTFGCVRKTWNLMLEAYHKTGRIPTPATFKDEFPYLREIDSFALCNAQLHLDKAIRDHRDNPGHFGPPKWKAKYFAKRSYTTNRDRRSNNIHIEDIGSRRFCGLRLPKVQGLVKLRMHREPPADAVLKSVTVSQTSSGKWYAAMLYEVETQPTKPLLKTLRTVGIDYSSHDFGVTDEGVTLSPPHAYRKAEERLALERRRLSRMAKHSKNWQKQKQRIARLEEHVANQRKDFVEKLSRKITDSADAVFVEDLDLTAQAQSLSLGKSVHDNGFGMFRARLADKLEEKGAVFLKVPQFFASTQLCNGCRQAYKGVKGLENLGVRKWTCPCCGQENDRDANAAKNIRDKGLADLNEETGQSFKQRTAGLAGIASLCSDGGKRLSKRDSRPRDREAPTSNATRR